MSDDINTHNLRIGFGKHCGELWTRVPVGYLKYLVNTPAPAGMDSSAGRIAAAELKRRGTVTPTLEVSGHAIDRASLSCRRRWHETAIDEQEGLHAWLCRMAQEALDSALSHDGSKIEYQGLKFAFEYGEAWPVLKTVMPA